MEYSNAQQYMVTPPLRTSEVHIYNEANEEVKIFTLTEQDEFEMHVEMVVQPIEAKIFPRPVNVN